MARAEKPKAVETWSEFPDEILETLYEIALEGRYKKAIPSIQEELKNRGKKEEMRNIFDNFARGIELENMQLFTKILLELYGEDEDGAVPDVAIIKATQRFSERNRNKK
jgi:hypothetical protein